MKHRTWSSAFSGAPLPPSMPVLPVCSSLSLLLCSPLLPFGPTVVFVTSHTSPLPSLPDFLLFSCISSPALAFLGSQAAQRLMCCPIGSQALLIECTVVDFPFPFGSLGKWPKWKYIKIWEVKFVGNRDTKKLEALELNYFPFLYIFVKWCYFGFELSQAGLELQVFLPFPAKCWDYKWEPLCLIAFCGLLAQQCLLLVNH